MSGNRKTWKIGSGARLAGTVRVHGNKNSALPCLAAALLLPVGKELRLTNVPRISDVTTLCEILEVYGVRTTWEGPSSVLLVRVRYENHIPDVPLELTRRIRGSIILLGALATQYRNFYIARPGGDRIGTRPITAHLTALADLGYAVNQEPHALTVTRLTPDIRDGTVLLIEQSVTATLMLLLYSACLGPGQHLTILDAASEPHIVTLCTLLSTMGADIDGLYSNLLTIRWPHGVHAPKNPVRIDDDFMEASTYAVAAAITKSDLTIPFHHAGLYLSLVNRYVSWMGVQTVLGNDSWHISGSQSDLKIHPALTVIKSEPWPRFPTDVLSMFVVLATQCTGTLKFVEYMYDDRFGFVQSLRDIGARIEQQSPHAIVVHGPTPLSGNELFLRPDIRSGAAMLLAALAASGTTVLHDRGGVIERGYERLPQTMADLGAPIEQIDGFFD